MGDPLNMDESVPPGMSVESFRKMRAKRRMLDAVAKGLAIDSAAGVKALPVGMNMNQRRMLDQIEK